MKAASAPGISIVATGEEKIELEKIPLGILNLDANQSETFGMWGIRRLGQLAALPEVELIARFGSQASRWRAMAAGEAAHNFQPIEPALELCEYYEFDPPIEEIDSLLFIAARMLDSLVARASARSLALASLDIQMRIEGGAMHQLSLHPAIPSADHRFLLKLLQLQAGAHPPQGAVLTLAIKADAGQTNKVQLGLFAPQKPDALRLDVTLARIRAMVGEGRVGAPLLKDTHRPHSFCQHDFDPDVQCTSSIRQAARIALRRVRPPRSIRVMLQGEKPAAFRDSSERFSVTAAYGPWRSSGSWWSQDAWDVEEWDVLATNGAGQRLGCLLVRDRLRGIWQLEALFD
jgi:protein ImuB